MQGIYGIHNLVSDKWYVGQSVDIDRRWIDHRTKLKCGKPPNPHLKNAWDKYGEDVFEFVVLEEVLDAELLTAREEFWVTAKRNASSGVYNQREVVDSCRGMKASSAARAAISASMTGRKLSDAHREHLVSSWTPARRAAHGRQRQGHDVSDVSREKMSIVRLGSRNPFSKLTESQVVVIKSKLVSGEKCVVLAQEYGVCLGTISAINVGKTWRHVGVSDV